MRLSKPNTTEKEATWKVCLNCGNRFQAGSHGYRVNWCSPGCETATLRRQRDDIENSWMRSIWFLR